MEARIVQTIGVRHAADNGGMVHQPRELGEVLADLQPGDRCGDGIEFATHIRRGGGLHVQRVEMTRPTITEQENAGLDGRRSIQPRRLVSLS